MKKILFITFVTTIIFCNQGSAQHRWEGGGRPRSERLERFHKMRLIETLNLKEEESVRFFAKQNAHEDKVRELMNTRNSTLDAIEDATKEDGKPEELEKLSNKIKEVDKEIFSERQRYQDEVKQLLTPVQFGKFLVFERNFGRQVRDAIQEMNQERKNPKPE